MTGPHCGALCTRRRCYCCLLLVLVALLVALYALYRARVTAASHNARRWDPVLVGSRYRYPTAPPYTHFIEPWFYNFKRKFYSGILVNPQQQQQQRQPPPQPRPTNVTIFSLKPGEAEELRQANACVPFLGPAPDMTICVYDREVDQMISAYIRDYGEWEKEQVGDMVRLLRADEERRRGVMLNRREGPGAGTAADRKTEVRPVVTGLRDGDTKRKVKWDDEAVTTAAGREKESAVLGTRAGRKRRQGYLGREETDDKEVVRKIEGHVAFGPEPRFRRLVRETAERAGARGQAERAKASAGRALDEGAAVTPARGATGAANVSAMMSVVDVGCNVGVYTLSAAGLGHPVLAVDPVKSSLRLLATSLRLNHLESSSPSSSSSSPVTLLLNAVTDRPGLVTVNVNRGNIGGSSVSAKRGHGGDAVWAVCLDHLVPHVPTRRVFLKLDIEGWEERALRCAGEFFQRLDVRYVMMEWLFYRTTRGGPAVIGFMARNGLLPYSDAARSRVLNPDEYYAWPDNMLWAKR